MWEEFDDCCETCRYWEWEHEEYTEESVDGFLNWGYCSHPLSPYYQDKICGGNGCRWRDFKETANARQLCVSLSK